MPELTLIDETTSGQETGRRRLIVPQSTLTVAELIEARVRQEFKEAGSGTSNALPGLVQPSKKERLLNPGKPLAWKKEETPVQVQVQDLVNRALKAFESNGFFLLVDGHQPTELQESIRVTPETEISFIKLTPLVGG
jgi:hypothetical protein